MAVTDGETARWLYHVVLREELTRGDTNVYAPASLAHEGFIHASYKPAVAESAQLYFPAGAELVVLRIDPRVLAEHGVALDVASTPRGPMPHILGPLPRRAIVEALRLEDLARAPDEFHDTLAG